MISSKEGWWMKRFVAVLLSGWLVCALSVLGGIGTPASDVAGSPTSDTPTVTGGLLNPVFFAHGAYVMQGVSDPAEVFALPLLGVPELSFFPTASGIDPSTVTWKIEVSHPEGISAEIRDNVLHIWGNNATWAGYGAVTLTATADGALGSVVIPVTVFRTDKTLINAEGKKDYFVPWSPQLDINRILSVEEHMRKYNKDEGQLDRTVQWSRWRRMWQLKDVTKSTAWRNEVAPPGGWGRQQQLTLVDMMLGDLAALGVKTVRIENPYYIMTLSGTDIVPVYDRYNWGPTMRADELEYFIDEAHRLGMGTLLANWIGVDIASTGGKPYEIFQAQPPDMTAFWASNLTLTLSTMEMCTELGVEVASLGDCLEYVGPATAANRQRTSQMLSAAASASRTIYPGPIAYLSGISSEFERGESLLEAAFWGSVDILAAGINQPEMRAMASTADPSVAEVAQTWERWIQTFFQPFQERFNKPFIAHENGCLPINGSILWGVYSTFHFDTDPHFPETARIDISDMAIYYASQIQAFKEMDGYYGPGWYAYDFDPGMLGGVEDPTRTPRLKVDDVIAEDFLGHAVHRVVAVDGLTDDWPSEAALVSDPTGDSDHAGDDITALWAVQDERYLYIRVDYSGEREDTLNIDISIDGDSSPEFTLNCNAWPYKLCGATFLRPQATLYRAYRWTDTLGVADIVFKGDHVELQLYKPFLSSDAAMSLRLRAAAYTAGHGEVDATSWSPEVPAAAVGE